MNKWKAEIYVSGLNRRLGYYEEIKDAVSARERGELKYRGVLNKYED